MSKFFIERVEYNDGEVEYEIKMKSATPNGVAVLITSRFELDAARHAVDFLSGRQEVSRRVIT